MSIEILKYFISLYLLLISWSYLSVTIPLILNAFLFIIAKVIGPTQISNFHFNFSIHFSKQ